MALCFLHQMNTIERRLRANGEKEETIAKYKDVDAYLKRLENKLREGSTLDVGRKGRPSSFFLSFSTCSDTEASSGINFFFTGNNKVSNLASQLSSKLTSATPLDKPKSVSINILYINM